METGSFTGAMGDTAEATAGEDAQRRSIDAVDALLDEVEQALARLDDGSYGRCEGCGEPIADERLAELAIVRTCGPCAGIGTPDEPAPAPSAWPAPAPAPSAWSGPGSMSESPPQVDDDLPAPQVDDTTDDTGDDTIDF